MKIATVRGIALKLHLSTLLIVGLVGFYAANFYFNLLPEASIVELLLVGIINGTIILFSIIAHELTHSIIAQKYGLVVKEIELYLFGGVSKIEQEPKTPKSEFVIAVMGPVSSLIIGALLMALFFLPINYPSFLSVTLLYSGISNIGLGIFNLIPAFPIDGGRVLRALLWKRRGDLLSATKTASRVGVIFGYGMVAYGLLQSFFLGLFGGFWLVIMGFFLTSTAKNAYIQTRYGVLLSKVNAIDISSIPYITIPFNTQVNDAISNYFMVYKKSYFPVSQVDRIVGIVTMEDLRRIPYELRNEYIVGYIMKKISDFPEIDEGVKGDIVLSKLGISDRDASIIVVKDAEGDKILGFITREEIVSALKYAELGIQEY
jgi:Zn-dependent protease